MSRIQTAKEIILDGPLSSEPFYSRFRIFQHPPYFDDKGKPISKRTEMKSLFHSGFAPHISSLRLDFRGSRSQKKALLEGVRFAFIGHDQTIFEITAADLGTNRNHNVGPFESGRGGPFYVLMEWDDELSMRQFRSDPKRLVYLAFILNP